MACKHLTNLKDLKPPRPNQVVYREECVYCFDTIDNRCGIDVCLICFTGHCSGERNHSQVHLERSGHSLILNIRRKRKVTNVTNKSLPTKLCIMGENEQSKYDYETSVNCLECQLNNINHDNDANLKIFIDSIMKAHTSTQREEIKSWENSLTFCEHTKCIEQFTGHSLETLNLTKCSECDLKQNLWLCLTCGNVGCGRAQWGSVGGNSHALAHNNMTNHPVTVKLGSLTVDGTADVFCYTCQEERIDPNLVDHLAHWNIDLKTHEKTEKSLSEIQIEHNHSWEFSMTNENGNELVPVYGPGLTGLKNLGNSCYINSCLQAVFSLPEFRNRFFVEDTELTVSANPPEDLEVQLRKLGDGLHSGRYASMCSDLVSIDNVQTNGNHPVTWQKGILPSMLKYVVGKDHAEFASQRQQDAFEFLIHLFELISKMPHSSKDLNPVESFRFALEQKLKCMSCHKVRLLVDVQDNISIYIPAKRKVKAHATDNDLRRGNGGGSKDEEFEPVSLKECIDLFTSPEVVDLKCSGCGSTQGFTKQVRFKTFPRNLVINARRFELVNWVPTKRDVPVIVDDEGLDLSKYKAQDLEVGEELMEDDDDMEYSERRGFSPNEEALVMLESMGFPRIRCEKALEATGNNDVEAASNWIFEHMDDPTIDEPKSKEEKSLKRKAGIAIKNEEVMEQLKSMGFSEGRIKRVMRKFSHISEMIEWLFSNAASSDDEDEMADNTSEENVSTTTVKPESENILAGQTDCSAKYYLESVICHKGSSIHAGHYVSFVRKEIDGRIKWVLFNDEKVAVASKDADEMKKFAYIYIFRMV